MSVFKHTVTHNYKLVVTVTGGFSIPQFEISSDIAPLFRVGL